MLTGRESLIRLIGKRRRILPNRESLLLLTHPQNASVNPRNESEEEVSNIATNISESSKSGKCSYDDDNIEKSDFVTCPVCGNTVQGSDDILNSHLDMCLKRGTKRKLKQQTLLQFSFSSRSKPKSQADESDSLGTNPAAILKDEVLVQNNAPKPGRIDDNYTGENESSLNSLCDIETCEEVKVNSSSENNSYEDDNVYNENVIKEKDVDAPSSSVPIVMLPQLDVDKSADDESVAVFNTVIVGRRFGDEVELKIGDGVSFLRDQDNEKDPNAVKVLSMDSGCQKVIGFIPRKLARYLSPLIAKGSLSFEVSQVFN